MSNELKVLSIKEELTEDVTRILDYLGDIKQTIEVRGAVKAGINFRASLGVIDKKFYDAEEETYTGFELSDDAGLKNEETINTNIENLSNQVSVKESDRQLEEISLDSVKKKKK